MRAGSQAEAGLPPQRRGDAEITQRGREKTNTRGENAEGAETSRRRWRDETGWSVAAGMGSGDEEHIVVIAEGVGEGLSRN